MKIQTKAYGLIEIDEKQRIAFPSGLYGFEQYHDYALIDAHQPPFYWLQSLDDPQTAFVLINPYVFRPDYVLEVPDGDLEEIGSPPEEDLLVFAIVTIPEDNTEITANLQGPIIINRKSRYGKQAITLNQAWQTKHVIVSELARKS